MDLAQRLRHPQAGRMQRPSLIVVEDPAHRRAVVEDHRARGIDHGRRPVRRHGRRDSGFRRLGREVFLQPSLGPRQHGLFDRPQAADLLSHLDLGVAIGLEDRLGHVAEEVVVAVAMGHLGELRGDPRDEGVLPVGQPEGHRLVQCLGPLPGLDDQAADLGRGGGEQRLGKPDSLLGQLADDVEGLVPLLRLDAVDAEDEIRHRVVLSAERLGILLPRASMTWYRRMYWSMASSESLIA